MTNIIPLGNKIQLDIKDEKIGAIQTEAIQEQGVILEIGEWVPKDKYPIGATLYFKAWAVDIITDDKEKYYFISCDSDAICAIQKKK